MSLEDVVYAVIAGAAIVLLGFAFRPRRGGRPITNDERVEALGWVLVAMFLIFMLQLAGVGREFAILSGAAGVLVGIYLLGRRVARKPGS
jgi:hypothetical protein